MKALIRLAGVVADRRPAVFTAWRRFARCRRVACAKLPIGLLGCLHSAFGNH